MASSTGFPATDSPGVYGARLKTMSRRMLAQVLDAARVMGHYPAVVKDMCGSPGGPSAPDVRSRKF